MNDSNWNPQVNSQVPPPSYSSVTGYDNYPQGSFQSAAAYPPPQGHAATGEYQSQGYPQGYPQGGCYTNYNQPYAAVTQNTQNVFVEPMKDYTCLAIVALLLCLPTGIAAIIKSNDAQHEYRMGNIAKARACNRSARTFINFSLGLGLGLIVLAIIITLVIFVAVANSENNYM